MTLASLQLVCALRPPCDVRNGLSDALACMDCDDESAKQHLIDEARR